MRARGSSFFASTICEELRLFFLLDFRERFLVSLALELPCVIVMLNEKY